MSVSVLSDAQFSRRKIKTDPQSDRRKAKFGGSAGSKTMRVDRGSGLGPPPRIHPHRKRVGKRVHRESKKA